MEKPVKTIVFILALVAGILFSGTALAEVLSVPDDFGRIEEAVDAAKNKDTILIEQDFLPGENIRELDTRGKALTIAVSEAATAGNVCPIFYDFESYAEGTAITDLPGVTFEVIGNAAVGLHIEKNNWFGNNFASKVLLIDTHPQDFSPDHFQMIFDDPQYEVRFNIGPEPGYYNISVYNAASGGTRIMFRSVYVPGTGVFTGMGQSVRFSRAAGDIRRIVIVGQGERYEAIDNLTFGYDPTPPEIRTDEPSPLSCVSGSVTFRGIVCDDDGTHKRDRLEYRRIHPNPDSGWVLVREYVDSPVCTPNSLYTWDTTDPDIIDGVYLLRITAENDCGLTQTEEIPLYVDNTFDSLEFAGPSGIVGGDICFTGTVWDRYCFEQYTVDYRPAAGGAWAPVDKDFYDTTKVNESFAVWKDAASLDDGDYIIRLTGRTTTGKTDTETKTLTLDNTPPTAIINLPKACTNPGDTITFMGTAHDANLYRWTLDRWIPETRTWSAPIKTSASSVIKGELATWTRGPDNGCPDLIRLRVWDKALVSPCGQWGRDRHYNETFLILTRDGGCNGDYDGDGDVDGQDLEKFAADFGVPRL